jgi:hypothetical protein
MHRQPVQRNSCHSGPMVNQIAKSAVLLRSYTIAVSDNAWQPDPSDRQHVQHHLCSTRFLNQLFTAQAHQNSERTRRSSLNPTDNLYNITHGIHSEAKLLYQLFTAQAHQNSERTRRSSLNPLTTSTTSLTESIMKPGCYISCFLRRRTRTQSGQGAAA